MSILPSSAARAQRRGEKRPAFPKPRGAAPGDAHGALCTWNFEGGGWVDSHGIPHVVVKNPKRREAAQRDDRLAAAVDSAEPSPSPPSPTRGYQYARGNQYDSQSMPEVINKPARQRRHPGPGWEWDDQWRRYFPGALKRPKR